MNSLRVALRQFERIVGYGVKADRLAVKFLFEPNAAQFTTDRETRLEYTMWVQEIAKGTVKTDKCLDVVGHTSATGSVVNADRQYHSFHIHQTGFLVTEINGVRQNEDSLRDTFSMLPATDAGPSVLKVVIPFTDPVIVGRFVYHCHAVDHEDKGMMGVVEVVQ